MTTYTEEDGRFSFDISYRRFQGDRGLSIKVLGPVVDESRELLRFDCFEKTPHYHVEVYDKNEITAIKDSDPAHWSLNKLREEFEDLVLKAGCDPMNEEERENLDAAIARVQEKSLSLIEAETAL